MRPRADHISPKLVNLLEVRIVLITCKRMKKSGTKIRIQGSTNEESGIWNQQRVNDESTREKSQPG